MLLEVVETLLWDGGAGVGVVAFLQFSHGGQTPSKGDGQTFPGENRKRNYQKRLSQVSHYTNIFYYWKIIYQDCVLKEDLEIHSTSKKFY